jgi:hypothetical protein
VITSFFWAITQRVVIMPYRNFGTIYRCQLQGLRIQEILFCWPLRLGIPSGLFTSFYPPNLCTHLSSPPYVLHASPISIFLTGSSECYLVWNTRHKCLRFVIFSGPFYLFPLRSKYLRQDFILNYPQRMVHTQCKIQSFILKCAELVC